VKVGVLPDHRNADPGRRGEHMPHQLVPIGQDRLGGLQVETVAHQAIKTLGVEAQGDLVDGRHIGTLDDTAEIHIAEKRYLAFDLIRQGAFTATDQEVGLDPDFHEVPDGVLGRLGFQLPRGRDVGHQGQVDEQGVLPADLMPELADRLQKRE